MQNGTDIYLICGATGAGKSTHAAALAKTLGGVCFSIDDWMQRLYNADKPETAVFSWLYERVERSWAQMRDTAERLVALGVPVVFDCGLSRKSERDIFAKWALAQGYALALHFVDLPAATRWQRVQQRNKTRPETYRFDVTREMFDFVETMWEAPDAAEMAALNGARV